MRCTLSGHSINCPVRMWPGMFSRVSPLPSRPSQDTGHGSAGCSVGDGGEHSYRVGLRVGGVGGLGTKETV